MCTVPFSHHCKALFWCTGSACLPTKHFELLLTHADGWASPQATAGPLREGQTVLVTAAGGATGHMGAQLAMLAGCRVVATCGSQTKAERLRGLGIHRVINYREEVSSNFSSTGQHLVAACSLQYCQRACTSWCKIDALLTETQSLVGLH